MQSIPKLRSILSLRSAPVENKWGGIVAVCSPEYQHSDPFIFAVYHDHKLQAGTCEVKPRAEADKIFKTLIVYFIASSDTQNCRGTNWISAASPPWLRNDHSHTEGSSRSSGYYYFDFYVFLLPPCLNSSPQSGLERQ
jgi:hypothetical protein